MFCFFCSMDRDRKAQKQQHLKYETHNENWGMLSYITYIYNYPL